MTKKHIVIFAAVLVAVIGAGLALHIQNKLDSDIPPGEIIGGNTDSLIDTGGNQNYTIQIEEAIKIEDIAPSLEREVAYGENVPPEVRTLLQGKIDEVRNRLKGDIYRADDWMGLGVLYHSANDWIGCRDVWQFLIRVMEPPATAVLYDNLGKLYKFDLKDFPASESYFKESIAANPESLTPYLELFELYRYLYKTDTSAAVDILLEAQRKFPGECDPHTVLAGYYRDTKQYAKARAEFEKALDLARAANDLNMTSVIGNELQALPQ